MEEFIDPKQITDAMKQGLARMYGDAHMRDYLTNAIAVAKTNALTCVGLKKFEEASDFYSRAKALEQLLKKGKDCFIHFESIKSKLKNNGAKNH